jgi:hypothetical protein
MIYYVQGFLAKAALELFILCKQIFLILINKPRGMHQAQRACKVCSVKFTEDKAEVLECEYCEKHFRRSCVKLSSTEYKLLTKRSDLLLPPL